MTLVKILESRIERKATGASIVVVDDESLIVELTEEMLREAGYEVAAFNDPRDALPYIQDNIDDIDLVLTDMTMPYMTGDVLAAEIQGLRPGLPLVVMTPDTVAIKTSCSITDSAVAFTNHSPKTIYYPVSATVLVTVAPLAPKAWTQLRAGPEHK